MLKYNVDRFPKKYIEMKGAFCRHYYRYKLGNGPCYEMQSRYNDTQATFIKNGSFQ